MIPSTYQSDVALVQVVKHLSFGDSIKKAHVRQLQFISIAPQLIFMVAVSNQQEPNSRTAEAVSRFENRFDLFHRPCAPM